MSVRSAGPVEMCCGVVVFTGRCSCRMRALLRGVFRPDDVADGDAIDDPHSHLLECAVCFSTIGA